MGLQLGREQRDPVQEQCQVQAVLVPLAVLELPDHAEDVALIERPERLVQPAHRAEIGEADAPTGHLDAVPEQLERAPLPDLAGDPLHEVGPDVVAVVLPELLPRLGLGGLDEAHEVVGDQAEGPVVLLGAALVVAAGMAGAVPGLRLGDAARCTLLGVGPAAEHRGFDVLLKPGFGDLNGHGYSG